jgi:hypothetical protein
LNGELDQIGLSTLLTVLDIERVSGVVVVRRGGQTGQLWMRAGRMLRAVIDGGPVRLSGKVAACDMLAWGAGRFEVFREEVEGADEIGTSTAHLLMEAAMRVDESGSVLQF